MVADYLHCLLSQKQSKTQKNKEQKTFKIKKKSKTKRRSLKETQNEQSHHQIKTSHGQIVEERNLRNHLKNEEIISGLISDIVPTISNLKENSNNCTFSSSPAPAHIPICSALPPIVPTLSQQRQNNIAATTSKLSSPPKYQYYTNSKLLPTTSTIKYENNPKPIDNNS